MTCCIRHLSVSSLKSPTWNRTKSWTLMSLISSHCSTQISLSNKKGWRRSSLLDISGSGKTWSSTASCGKSLSLELWSLLLNSSKSKSFSLVIIVQFSYLYMAVTFCLRWFQYLNCRGDASPHRSRLERWMIRRKRPNSSLNFGKKKHQFPTKTYGTSLKYFCMPNAFGQGCKSVPPCKILQFKYWLFLFANRTM